MDIAALPVIDQSAKQTNKILELLAPIVSLFNSKRANKTGLHRLNFTIEKIVTCITRTWSASEHNRELWPDDYLSKFYSGKQFSDSNRF